MRVVESKGCRYEVVESKVVESKIVEFVLHSRRGSSAHQPGQRPAWQPPRKSVPLHQPVQPGQHPTLQPRQHPAQQPTRESVIARALIETLLSLTQDLLNF